MAEGKVQRSSGGKFKRNANGKLVRNNSTSATCCCEGGDWKIMDCCTDVQLEDHTITGVSKPFYFKYNDVCYYAGDANTPSETNLTAEDVEQFDSCLDCTAGSDCNACASEDACSYCLDECEDVTNTPTEFTVTVSSVTMDTSCITTDFECTNGGSGAVITSIQASGWAGATFTVSQVSACQWEGTFTGPSVAVYSSLGTPCVDDECSGGVTQYTARLYFYTSGITKYMRLDIVGVVDSTDCLYCEGEELVALFSGQVAFPNYSCCRTSTLTGLTGSYSDEAYEIGSGGSATVTPC